jgi:hypothetical protein
MLWSLCSRALGGFGARCRERAPGVRFPDSVIAAEEAGVLDYDGEEGCEGRLRRLRAGDNSEVVIVDIEKMMTTIRAGGRAAAVALDRRTHGRARYD